MKSILTAAVAIPLTIAAAIAFAQAADEADGGPVSAESNWWLTNSSCLANASWPGDPPYDLYLEPHADHHHLAVLTGAWQVKDGDTATMSIGFDEQPPTTWADQSVLGYAAGDLTGWTFEVDAALLAELGKHKSIEFYRDGSQIVSLDLQTTDQAVAAVEACHAAASVADNAMTPAEDAMAMDSSASEAAAMAAEDATQAVAVPN